MRDKPIELHKVKGEDNPADLFTKHLVSRERIHGLLELFGCVYRGGRADKAPKMRAGIGTSKGEMLELKAEPGEEVMTWEGRLFRVDRTGGSEEELPQAFPTVNGLLPHLHDDLEDRFPKATAGPGAGDEEPSEDQELERRGETLGKNKARFGKTETHLLSDHFEHCV